MPNWTAYALPPNYVNKGSAKDACICTYHLGAACGYAGNAMNEVTSLAVLPLPNFRKPMRDAAIIDARAKGLTMAEVAKEACTSERTAYRVQQEHKQFLDAQQQHWGKKVLAGFGRLIHGRMDAAADAENKQGARSFEALCEKLLGWGIRGGNVHIEGGVSIGQVDIDARSIVVEGKSVPDLEREIEQLRGGLGVE